MEEAKKEKKKGKSKYGKTRKEEKNFKTSFYIEPVRCSGGYTGIFIYCRGSRD